MSNGDWATDGTPHSLEYQKRLREALWHKGSLVWKLYPYQKEIYDQIRSKGKEPQNLFVLHASRRLGKSFILSIIALEDCLSGYNKVVKFCAPEAKQIREAIQPMLSEILQDCPKKLRPKFNKASLTYFFPKTGSTLILHGLDEGRAESVRGAKSDKTIVDEAGFVGKLKDIVVSILLPLTLTTKGQTILSSNSPLTSDHDFCQYFTPQAITSGSYLKKTIYDNTTLTPEDISRVIEQCGGAPSSDFRREYLCEFTIDLNTAILPEFADAKSFVVVPKIEVPAFYKPFVSMDLGYNDGTGVVFGYYDFERATIVIQDEYLVRGQNSENISKVCLAKERSLWGDPSDSGKAPLRFADAQPLTISDLSTTNKYSVCKTNNQNLEAGVNKLRLLLQAHTVEISEKCIQLIHQCETGTWDKSKTKFARPTAGNHFDLLAALVYFVRHIPKQNPFPAGYGFDRHTQQRRGSTELQPDRQVWVNLFGRRR